MSDKIAIVTDSTCDLDAAITEEYSIHEVPLLVYCGEREYRDGVDLTSDDVYDRLDTESPRTSLPSPRDVMSLLERLKAEGFTHVVAIHLSSGLSGTVNMMRTMASNIKGMVMEVVDSKSISLGLGLSVLEAAKAVRANLSFHDVVARTRRAVEVADTFFVIGTLKYLIRGGRIGRIAGALGTLLDIRPVVSIDRDGVYYTFAKARGRKKSLDVLFQVVKERIGGTAADLAVAHGRAEAEAQQLIERLRTLPNVKNILVDKIGPTVAAHAGPGTVGVAVLPAE